MKKTMLLAAAVLCGSVLGTAQLREPSDTLQLQEIEVLATRATSNTPAQLATNTAMSSSRSTMSG